MHRSDYGIPTFFKVWFAFVACLAVGIMIASGFVIYSIVAAGPEGIGKEVGKIVRGFEEGRR